jgi:hypothetical protein
MFIVVGGDLKQDARLSLHATTKLEPGKITAVLQAEHPDLPRHLGYNGIAHFAISPDRLKGDLDFLSLYRLITKPGENRSPLDILAAEALKEAVAGIMIDLTRWCHGRIEFQLGLKTVGEKIRDAHDASILGLFDLRK